MNTYKQAHIRLISAVALLVIGCERAPGGSVRRDSSVVLAAAETPLAAVAAQGSFAYVDSSGTQLLAVDSLPDPSTIFGALCSRGVALPVRYDRKQARQANDNGRQVASNFRNEKGDVFRVIQEKAPPDKTCYLLRDSALLASARTATMREPSDCSPVQVSRLAAAKGRHVIHCWRIAAAPTDLEVLAVQFANIDSSALGSLAVVGDGSLLFKDFPAVYHGPDESTWRVDDEGVFSPKDFDILFVAAMPYGYVMAITWAGAEGESCELLIADSAGVFRTLTKAYRYRAPT
jgi:hypothetical protein